MDFVGQMRTELGRMVNPQDQSIESVLPGVLSGINQLRATIESRSEALTERVSDIVFKIKQLIVEANVETKEGLKEDLAIQLGRMATKLSGGKFRLKSRGGSGSVPKEMAEEEDDDDDDDVDGRHDAESDKDTVVPQQAGSEEGFQKHRRSWIVFGTILILQEQKITSSKTGDRNAFAIVIWSSMG